MPSVHVLAQWYIFCCLQGSAATHNYFLIFSSITTQVLDWSFTKGDFRSTDIFPFLFLFTDEARGKNCGVLVHCLAGISRSVTVTVAYLMQKLNLSMNDAYDIVKMKKSNISPNFNFMGQLLDFERTLGLSSPCDNRVPTQQLYFTTPSNQNVYQVDSLQSTWRAPPTGMCPVDL